MTRIIVTGAAGFIGSATLQQLNGATRTGRTRVLALDLATSDLLTSRSYDAAYCDITTPNLHKYIKRGDKVLHLAAIATFQEAKDDPMKALRVNVGGTLNIVEACNKAGAERLVFSSTGSVLSPKAEVPFKENAPTDPPNVYGFTKLMAEKVIRRYCKVPWVILRYGYVYGATKLHGAIGAFFKLLREDKQPQIFGGKQTNDFTFIDDIVQANRKALHTEHTNQLYHIGSGRANSILDVYDACAEALGKKIKPEMAPEREGDYPVFLYDIEKARKLLKYQPNWTLREGIKRMVQLLAEDEEARSE